MVESAPAQAAAAPAKAGKKKFMAKPNLKNADSSVTGLIVKAVAASKERGGVSTAAVKKALTAGGYDVEKNNSRVNTSIKNLVTKGTLVQTKGTGASGSFKISKQATENPAKKVAPKAKKLKAKSPKAVAVKKSPKKKPAAAKKSAAAKSPKKAAKSPKKPTKSPKKLARKAPTARIDAAVKKTPAKKAAPKKK